MCRPLEFVLSSASIFLTMLDFVNQVVVAPRVATVVAYLCCAVFVSLAVPHSPSCSLMHFWAPLTHAFISICYRSGLAPGLPFAA